MPRVIFDETTPRPVPSATWLTQRHVRETLILNENIPVSVIRHVIDVGYAPDLTDVEIDAIGKDPFLVASALSGTNRVVVTLEVSKPSKRRQNRKVPDVWLTCGVRSIGPFELYRLLNFSIP
jgi:hypothetical protein